MRPRPREWVGSKPASLQKLALGDEPAAHQLVGRVMAYQGRDG
jgi:hypothetical protein